MNYFFILIFISFSFLVISCKSSDTAKCNDNKLDAASKSELQKAESSNIQQHLSLVIMLNNETNEVIIDSLEKADVSVISIAGRIITAKAKPEAVRKILNFEFIKAIEINKTAFSN
ncbi:MAG: hypothetical protein RO257_03235 [Candidatus Kapabacteria bacterium]|nr:hypothetical protein [Candidatus Kapabacteria bacterium]